MDEWEEAERITYLEWSIRILLVSIKYQSIRLRAWLAGGAPAKKSVHTKSKRVAPKILDGLEANGELNKQKLFCLFYLQRFNITCVYQQAYGVSYSNALRAGSSLLEMKI